MYFGQCILMMALKHLDMCILSGGQIKQPFEDLPVSEYIDGCCGFVDFTLVGGGLAVGNT